MNADRRKVTGDPDSVLGAELRRIRGNLNLSQEELAQSIVTLGWSGATVAKIEAGTRKLSAVELIALSEAGLMHLRQPVAYTESESTINGWSVFEAQRSAGRHEKAFDAERRAAAALGVPVDRVADAAQRLWGRDFLAERTWRVVGRREAGDAAGRGATGRVSREMTEELRQALPKAKGKK